MKGFYISWHAAEPSTLHFLLPIFIPLLVSELVSALQLHLLQILDLSTI